MNHSLLEQKLLFPVTLLDVILLLYIVLIVKLILLRVRKSILLGKYPSWAKNIYVNPKEFERKK